MNKTQSISNNNKQSNKVKAGKVNHRHVTLTASRRWACYSGGINIVSNRYACAEEGISSIVPLDLNSSFPYAMMQASSKLRRGPRGRSFAASPYPMLQIKFDFQDDASKNA